MGNETGNSTTGETTIEVEPAEVPSPELTFHTSSGVLRVIHIGGEKITDRGMDEVYVTVDDERITTWVTDGDKGGGLPVSVGNLLEIESIEGGSMIEVVWVGSEGAGEVLATHEVGAGEITTITTMNGIAMNETTTDGIAMNETTTTMAAEATTSFGNETSN